MLRNSDSLIELIKVKSIKMSIIAITDCTMRKYFKNLYYERNITKPMMIDKRENREHCIYGAITVLWKLRN